MLLPRFLRALGKTPERRSALGALLVVLSSIGLTIWWNWYRFGSPFETGYQRVFQLMGTRVLEPEKSLQNLLALLFSPGRGLLLYAPVLLVLPLGWRVLRDFSSKKIRLAASSLFVVNLVFFACYSVWWGGFGWGPRFLIAPLVFLVPLFAAMPWRSPPVVVVLGLSVLVQLSSIVLPTSTEDHVASLARERGVPCDSWRLRCSGVWLRPKLALVALSNAARGQALPSLEEGAPASSEVALGSSDYRAPSWWPVRAAYRLGRQHLAPVALCFCVTGIVLGLFLVRLGLRPGEAVLREAH
jgi:hypothetical protein